MENVDNAHILPLKFNTGGLENERSDGPTWDMLLSVKTSLCQYKSVTVSCKRNGTPHEIKHSICFHQLRDEHCFQILLV